MDYSRFCCNVNIWRSKWSSPDLIKVDYQYNFEPNVTVIRLMKLLSFRLFYAGACEGQMPEILTMIQVTRLTPTPAVLCIAMLSLVYLASDNVYSLINYVGFATWVCAISLFMLPFPAFPIVSHNISKICCFSLYISCFERARNEKSNKFYLCVFTYSKNSISVILGLLITNETCTVALLRKTFAYVE